MLLNVQKVGNIINFTVSEDLLDKYNNPNLVVMIPMYTYIQLDTALKILYFKGAKMQFCIT